MVFSAEYRVDSHDVDINGRVSATSVMQYIQEAANLQHEAFGPKLPELREMGKAFIISRCALDVFGPLYAQDTVKVRTWLSEAKGYAYQRYSVLEKNGVKVASMSALWGAIDIESRRPIKVEEIPLGFTSEEGKTEETQAPIRFRIPRELELKTLSRHKVVYSDCDENLHMNNTRYPAVFCDALPDMRGKRVASLSLAFQNEARLGTEFDILSCEADGRIYFRSQLDDGRIGTECMMVLT